MKWFRHFSNASESSSLSSIIERSGIEGYGRYWLFVELMVRHWDGSSESVSVSLKTLSRQLGYYRQTSALDWADIGQTMGLFQYSLYDLNKSTMITIVFPKLKELQDKDSKYNRKRIVKNDNSTTIDKEEDKDKEEDNINTSKSTKVKFDLEKIYAEYPKKEGKKLGMNKLKRIIKTEEDFNKVLASVRNYSKLKYGTELKFIKQFSSFMSSWEDYLKIEAELDPMQALREKYQHTEVD